MSKYRIYIAGPLTPHDGGAIEYLQNCRRMFEAAIWLIKHGFIPFCPALDMHYFLSAPSDEEMPTGEEIKSYSLEWLKVCDAALLMPGWEKSGGAKKEIRIARKNDIPVFEKAEDLLSLTR